MKTCTQASCPGDDRCCGAAVTVRLWNHDMPLPEGASLAESHVVTDHHRHYGSVIQLPRDARMPGKRTRPRLSRAFPIRKAVELYAEGKSLREIAASLGYTFSSVRLQLIAAKVDLRSRGGAREMRGIPHPGRKAR